MDTTLNKRTSKVLFLLAITGIIFVLLIFDFWPIESFELKMQDTWLRLSGQRKISPHIVLIKIDDATLKDLGYPLSRDFYALLIDILSKAKVRTAGFDILFADPDRVNPQYDTLLSVMTEEAGNVCHAVAFEIKDERTNSHFHSEEMLSPLPQLVKTARSLGHINTIPDLDGVIRKVPVVIMHENKPYFSLATQMVMDYLKIPPTAVKIADKEVTLDNKIRIPTNRRGEVLVNYTTAKGFKECSLISLLRSFRTLKEGEIPEFNLADLEDKLVLVGVTATGTSDLKPTPLSPVSPGLLVHAHLADNILKGVFIRKASKGVNLLILLLFSLSMCLLLSYSALKRFAIIFIGFVVGYVILSFIVYRFIGLWIDTIKPCLVLSLSFLGVISYQLVRGEWLLKGFSLEETVRIKADIDKRMGDFSREITFLDVDIAGSTKIKEGEADADIIYTFGEYHRLLDKIALENKGSLFSRAGDGVIYKFSGDASQAVKTCIKIKESLVDFNKTVNKFRHPIVVRMGVNTGSILIDGTLKDGGGGKVPSRTIDLAGHLQKEAGPNEILISEEALNRLKEKDLFEERGYLQKDKIKVYRYKE